MSPNTPPPLGLIRERQLLTELLPVSHATLWRMVREGHFPRPFKLSPRMTVWRRDDVIAWIDARRPTQQEGK